MAAITTTKQIIERYMTEEVWQRTVIETAEAYGWRWYHTHDSRRSPSGFPDLVLVKPSRGRLLFVELKTERGRVREEQQEWLDALAEAQGDRAEVYVWRPSDWPRIEATLGGEDRG